MGITTRGHTLLLIYYLFRRFFLWYLIILFYLPGIQLAQVEIRRFHRFLQGRIPFKNAHCLTKYTDAIYYLIYTIIAKILRGGGGGWGRFRKRTKAGPLHFTYLFNNSRGLRLSTWFPVFLSVSFLVLVHLPFFLARSLLPFSWHVRTTLAFSLWSSSSLVLLLLILSHVGFWFDLSSWLHISTSHPHLIQLQSPFLAFHCCLCVCTMHQCWPYHCLPFMCCHRFIQYDPTCLLLRSVT